MAMNPHGPTAFSRLVLSWLLIATVLGTGVHIWQTRVQARQESLPVSYICPMPEHADVLETAPGKCPRCGMVLVPVIIDLAWSCPVHPVVIADRAGRCPLDKRDLVQVTISRYWTCPDKPQERLLSPGKCANGAARTLVREHRAHGDHNPKHGGQLFMASDTWHHIEAAYPRPGVLRVFVYDNFTKPLAVREFSGRAVTREQFDARTGTARDLEAFPLKPARDGKSFEVRIGNRALPARVTVKMKFARNGPEERFDFTFDALSKEPVAPPAFTQQTTAPRPDTGSPALAAPPRVQTPAAVSPAPSTSLATQVSPPPGAGQTAVPAPPPTNAGQMLIDPLQLTASLPADPAALLELLATQERDVRSLIESGQLGAVYIPAIQAKEVALAFETHFAGLPERRRREAAAAVKDVVRTAWELDAYGDLGDAQKLARAHAEFAEAVKALQSAYAAR